MGKLKKRIVYISVMCIIAAFLLTGCLQLNIDIGIDERFTSHLMYSIELDPGWVDPQYHETLANALNDLGWYYQEQLGFTVGLDADSDIYTLDMRKSVDNETLTDAFNSLENMLTDESSTALMRLDMAMESVPRAENYIISAMLDIPQIIRLSSAQELPYDLYLAFENGVLTSGGTITLTLPASELVEHSHNAGISFGMATMRVPLDFSSQTEFELSGSVNYAEDGTQTGAFSEILDSLIRTRDIVLIACGSAIALLLIILLVTLLKIRKHNKLYE